MKTFRLAGLPHSPAASRAPRAMSLGTEWDRFTVWGWSKCLKTWWS